MFLGHKPASLRLQSVLVCCPDKKGNLFLTAVASFCNSVGSLLLYNYILNVKVINEHSLELALSGVSISLATQDCIGLDRSVVLFNSHTLYIDVYINQVTSWLSVVQSELEMTAFVILQEFELQDSNKAWMLPCSSFINKLGS